MSDYNPNSIWGSKEKEYVYNPTPTKGPQPSSLTGPRNSGQQPSTSGGNDGDKKSFFKSHGLAWFGVGLVALLAGVGITIFVLNNHPAPASSITFTKPDQVLVGDPFILTVAFSNNSDQVLNNAQLSLQLPVGVSFLDAPATPDQRVMQKSEGDIGAQGIKSETFHLIVTGNPNTVDQLTAAMTYGTSANASTQYQASAQTDIAVGAPTLNFSFAIPQNVFSGQNFPIMVTYSNQSAQSISDAQFKMAYPPAFSFVSSSIPLAGPGNNIWDLGPLAAGASSTFTINGSITGPANAPYSLSGTMSGNFQGNIYPVATAAANITIASAPLSISVALNGTSSYVAAAGDQLNYTLTYANNSNVTFQSAIITAKLIGSMFDFSKLQSDGSFNSQSNTITWNGANVPALLSLAPGETGSVNFSLSAKTSFPIRLPSNINFLLKTIATIQSPTVPPNTAGGAGTQSVVELDNKMGGLVNLVTTGYRHEPTAGISNSGPYPPKVNQATTYTIHWIITNYSTDLSNVTVSAYLQSGSTFTGTVKSSLPSSTPTYDSGTGLVSWTIPFVPATTGILSNPLEATFQISNTPAVNQVGQSVTLMEQTSLTATDNFTGATLNASTQPVTTDLPDDSAGGGSSGVVVP